LKKITGANYPYRVRHYRGPLQPFTSMSHNISFTTLLLYKTMFGSALLTGYTLRISQYSSCNSLRISMQSHCSVLLKKRTYSPVIIFK